MVKSVHNEPNTNSRAEAALLRLFELAVVLGEYMERGLVQRKLTRARATVIWELHHRGAVTQRVLSEVLRVTPRNVTGLVDALEADGFVARTAHPTDRRATLVTLTVRGRRTATGLAADYRRGAEHLFGGLPAADLTGFLATTDAVLARLREADRGR
ncbi:MAG TPA: MarR family transcriptional regulator [Micromonosporaceae bacterium]|jgi:DNA-binding MarR family transcriptional regulator|nr:MarR family transcriptional regulator [Micromonosporaceae bacterium]